MNIANIPVELRKKSQWVGWTRISGRKVPMCPMTFRGAKSSDPSTWSTFTEALASAKKRSWSGIGFMFNKDYLGIDLDHCVENGIINPFGCKVMEDLNSYTELSPSKTGIHIIARGSIAKAMKTTEIEIYNTGRYFTVTGNVLRGRRLIKPVDVSGYYTETVTSTESIVDKIGNMKSGNVDNTLTSIAGSLGRRGFSAEQIFAILKDKANNAGHDDQALDRICKSVSRYHVGRENSYGHTSMEREEEESKPIEVFTPATHGAEYLKYLEESNTRDTSLFTGFPTLDGYTGGLKRKGIFVVGASTNVGKTSFSVTVANNLLKRGKRVLIFSTEMDWITTISRFLSIRTGISLHTITNRPSELSEQDKGVLKEHLQNIKSEPLFIVQESEPSLGVLAEEISRVRPDVFIFDYIQHAEESADNRHREIGRYMKGLENVAKEFNCAGIVTSQLNRRAETETPHLRHLSESGTIENTANAVVLLSIIAKGAEPGSDSIVQADLAKNRGPKGQVELRCSGVTAHFEEAG